MTKKASTTLLEQLHNAVALELLARISGDGTDGSIASAADIGAAIKFLKDNSITAVIEDNSAMSDLQKKIEERRARRKGTPAAVSGPLTESELDDAIDGFSLPN